MAWCSVLSCPPGVDKIDPRTKRNEGIRKGRKNRQTVTGMTTTTAAAAAAEQ